MDGRSVYYLQCFKQGMGGGGRFVHPLPHLLRQEEHGRGRSKQSTLFGWCHVVLISLYLQILLSMLSMHLLMLKKLFLHMGSDDGKELVHAHTYVRTCCRCVLVVMMGKS